MEDLITQKPTVATARRSKLFRGWGVRVPRPKSNLGIIRVTILFALEGLIYGNLKPPQKKGIRAHSGVLGL